MLPCAGEGTRSEWPLGPRRTDASPEGTVLDLVAADSDDDLDDDERAALHASIEDGLREAEAGDVVEASVVLARLRARAS